MSLADELLADLEEAAEEEEGGSYGEEEEEPTIEDVQEETQLDLSGDSVKSIAKLWDSKMFAEIMMKIEEYISKQAKASEVMGPVEAAPEYRVIVDANNLTVEIENELNIIHKFIRDKYSKRFPELESLVPNALDYIRTVKELGNSLDKCKNNENLQQILTNATIMVVSVTASTTQGQQLSEEELERLEEACDMALELSACKHRIYEYVESSGRVRQTQVNEATKARISKTLQRTLQKQSVVYGGKSTIRDRSSGTASSVAFTPLQGLEIVNPQAAEKKVAEANQKYFSSMAEFLKVKGEKSGIMST